MSRFWNSRVRGLDPYVPGEQPRMQRLIKLNTNENPFGPSPKALDAIRQAADEGLRLYPDPEGSELCQAVADFYGIQPTQVFVGNGSDEVLGHIFHGLFQPDEPVLFPDITYSFYPVYCSLYGLASRTVAVDEQFRIRPEAFQPPNGGVILPNPNAPTGLALSLAEIEVIVAANPDRVVVVDEAYVDFGAESAIALVDRYPNLLVTQTLSKSRSLAGLRVGFAVGDPELIEGLQRVKDSFNSYPVDRLALAGAAAAIRDQEHFERTRDAVIAERGRLTSELEVLGFEVLPSSTNFVLARHPDRDALRISEELRSEGIIVRHFKKPRIEQFLRITVGTPDQNDELLAALKAGGKA